MNRGKKMTRLTGLATVLGVTAMAFAAPVAAQAAVRPAASTSSRASVYSDQWEDGYRGWVQGGVIMICWADGAWADGTNRWYDIYAGSISGFVNADLVSQPAKVPECP
jgi:hypothetical protein